MIIDTHVHLYNPRYEDDLDAVLARAGQAGVRAAMAPGTDLASSRAAIALAERYAEAPCELFAAVGVHPTDAEKLTAEALDELRTLARHPRVVAIGEIGLDYHWPQVEDRGWPCAAPDQQRAAFEAQLALASDVGLPVIIHDRDAHDDTLAILRAWVAGNESNTGVLHFYVGGVDRLPQVLDLGFYIGVDGPVTFKNATEIHAVAREAPLDRLLLETDGPYLTPQPHRGQRNEPAYLTHVAERIAALRGVTPDAVAKATTANAIRLFDLPNLPL